MATAKVSARAAQCNNVHTNAPTFFFFSVLLNILQLALRTERHLLQCSGADPQTDHVIRAAEEAWSSLHVTAKRVLSCTFSTADWPLYAATTLVLSLERSRDHACSDTIHTQILSKAQELCRSAGRNAHLETALRRTHDLIAECILLTKTADLVPDSADLETDPEPSDSLSAP